MPKLLNLPEEAKIGPLTHGFFDDFQYFVTTDLWTAILTDSGTAAVGDAAGGVITLTPSDGSVADNDEAYIHTTEELFLFAAGKPAMVEARLQFSEANTDDANIMFGWVSGSAADAIQDDGAGPPASYSGAVFFKQDGQTLWSVEISLAGAQQTVQLTAANSYDGIAKTAGGSSYQKLRIVFLPTAGALADVLFYINDVLVYKFTDFTITSATEMDVFAGTKNGGANNQTLLIDYISAWQER